MEILVPLGDIFDKLAILSIKKEKIKDPVKQSYAQKEYQVVHQAVEKVLQDPTAKYHLKLLVSINSIIWDQMDGLRDMTPTDMKAAKLCYECLTDNDRRARVKRKVDAHLSSSLREVKSYAAKTVVFLGHLGLGDHINVNGLIRYLATCYDRVIIVCFGVHVKHLEAMYSDDPNIVAEGLDEKVVDVFHEGTLPACYQKIGELKGKISGLQTVIAGPLHYPGRVWKSGEGWEQLYESVGLDYSAKFVYEYLGRKSEEEEKVWKEAEEFFGGSMATGSYGFLHDDPSREGLRFPDSVYQNLSSHHTKWIIPRERIPQVDDLITGVKICYLPEVSLFSFPKLLEQSGTLYLVNSSFFCLGLCCDLTASQKLLWIRDKWVREHQGINHYFKYHPKVSTGGWKHV